VTAAGCTSPTWTPALRSTWVGWASAAVGRAELLARYGLDPARPVILFSGKLQPRKRPLDLLAAAGLLGTEVSTLFVGDGVLAQQLLAGLAPGQGAVTGFINQAEIPCFYHAADILVLPSDHEPWGLVVSEAVLAGILPVVSDRVECAGDLVRGTEYIYPCGDTYLCGDTGALAAGLHRALVQVAAQDVRPLMRGRAARYRVASTAVGFEQCRAGGRARPSSAARPGRGQVELAVPAY
jgi:glycosyltransferase involved in cell wall biosynthesis